MGNLKQLDLNAWFPLAEQDEISLKQVYAYLFQASGFDVGLDFDSIHKAASFVDSNVQDESAFKEVEDEEVAGNDLLISEYVRAKLLKHLCENIKDPNLQLDIPEIAEEQIDAILPKKHHHAFKHINVKDILLSMMSSARNDTFDTPLLRYIVARKHHVEGAVEMCIKCLNWRLNSHPVDSWFREGDAKIKLEGTHNKLVEAFRLNQAVLRGYDREGRVIVRVAVKKHFRHNCPDADFERFICLVIEYTRLCFSDRAGINKGVILFDMTGFSLKNADLHAVKFLVTAFEANYPEYLGLVLVHGAPWIFNSVWTIIKPWLDPVVAAKIHFTYKAGDLEKYIEPKHIPKALGGLDDHEPEYVEPTEANTALKPIDDKFHELLEERRHLMSCFTQSTKKWFQAKTKEDSYNYLVQRLKLQYRLSLNYIRLDPYLRHQSPFERNGQLTEIRH